MDGWMNGKTIYWPKPKCMGVGVISSIAIGPNYRR